MSAALPLVFLSSFASAQTATVTGSSATLSSYEAASSTQTQRIALRGVHMTGWGAGSPKMRRRMIADLKAAQLNAVVIALKEFDGRMFVKGVPLAREVGSYVNAIPDLPQAVGEFKAAGLYSVGRIVLFADDLLARRRPDLAVHGPDGKLWTNYKGVAWVDPYRKEVWDYDIEIASKAAAAGFDEIQFDYIRFPADGDTNLCRYSRADHSRKTAAAALVEFLILARARLKPLGVKLSIAVFGLTTTVDNGMGIGQHLERMAGLVDFVSPMMYPSHYHKGEYGIPNPNKDPYKTIHLGLRDASEKLGAQSWQLRPYFQDFSLGVRYGPDKVRAQILAAKRVGVESWILWNPQNRYTWSAVPKEENNEKD
ncbi:MAG: putative glycoside hydrolase [Elusimicrobia bacterium]|nr:putative glycoside hydrolase [Elusimicrobiota bacterium]